jgi:uncharacterized Zn-binding protein involved in type VI secretion
MPTGPVAVITSKLDAIGGVEGYNAEMPLGMLAVNPGANTVRAMGLPVATVATTATIHGNPTNPKLSGYNPICGKAVVVEGIPTILVEGKPVALAGPLGSLMSCGHWVMLSPAATVIVSGALG